MAKKTAKKARTAGKKPVRTAARKVPKKAIAKAPAKSPAKPAPRRSATGPAQVSSGRGSTPGEIGAAVVAHLNAGEDDAVIWDRYWSKDIESVEGGAGLAWRGRAAMEAKCNQWLAQNRVLGCRAEGPFVGSSGFAVRMTMDVEDAATGVRRAMAEVGVYTVRDGRVVREEFMAG